MSEVKKNQSPKEEKPPVGLAQNATKSKPMDKKISDQLSERVGPILEELNIDEAVLLARVPNSTDVAIYYRGHFYDAARLIADIHNKFKNKIADEIG